MFPEWQVLFGKTQVFPQVFFPVTAPGKALQGQGSSCIMTSRIQKGGPCFAEKITPYNGFELGPIRPPSEAYSLLLRINRGCGWNKCRFCGFYRDVPFSIRRAEDVKKDIDLIKYWVDVFQGKQPPRQAKSEGDYEACSMAYHWVQSGMESVFFQDGNSLLMPPDQLTDVLEYLNAAFPQIQRITTYARSDTINRLKPERLQR